MGSFFVTTLSDAIGKEGAGFFIVYSKTNIICTDSYPIDMKWKVEMEARALNRALEKISELNGRCSNIFISSNEFYKLLQGNEDLVQWHSSNYINEIRQRISYLTDPQIDLIHHSWNKIAILLANQGIKATQLSLYHQGMEKPKWLVKVIHQTRFHF